MSKLIQEIMDAINAVSKNKTEPYDRQGEVKRIEGKIAWVKLEGSDRETPIRMTIACDVGDTVQARIGGGSAWLTGNLTAPPTDDKKANQAISMVTNVVQEIQETVDEALEDVSTVDDVTMQYCLSNSSSTFTQYGDWSNTPPTYVSGKYYWTRTVLYDEDGNPTYGTPQYSQDTQLSVETSRAFNSNNNHFWYDSSGAYVTTASKNYSSGYATRITSSGILQSYNGNLLSSWTSSGISFYQGDANNTVTASFGSGGAEIYSGGTSVASFGSAIRLGREGYPHINISNSVIDIWSSAGVSCGYITGDGAKLILHSRKNAYVQIDAAGMKVADDTRTSGYANVILESVAAYGNVGADGNIYTTGGYFMSNGYKIITIGTATSDSLTINTGDTCALKTASASKTGYTPIGVVGYDIDGSGQSNINIFKMYISGSNVAFRVRNNYSSSWTGTIKFYVLYVASTQGY